MYFCHILVICTCFTLAANKGLATTNTKPIPHLKIELSLHLPNKLEYILQISNIEQGKKYQFYLNKGLTVKCLSKGDLLSSPTSDLEKYDFINQNDQIAVFEIKGQILSEDAVGPDVLVLNSGARWFPNFEELQTYDLAVKTDSGLIVFNPSLNSESCGENCNHFSESRPQEDIHLLVGKYTEYQKTLANRKKIGVLLLSKDDLLAQQYLDIIPEFLDRYENSFGEYPYSSFYVVENFNETGFGMPGFTLLGTSVIRLPFILRSSLPHEVLHNWWGNGVYVDINRGNWCEGLTTYGADHFEQERLGLDSNYRRDTLVKYADFVNSEKEFPLNKFTERHSEASQAIGYGKGMMLFHMLRKWVGNENFNRGLRNLYSKYKFQQISYDEIQSTFFDLTGKDTTTFMQPWINELGAVDIKVEQGCNTSGNVAIQINSTPNYFQYVLNYELVNSAQIREQNSIKILNGAQKIELPKNFSGLVKLDPNFDLFRKLSKGEKPLTLSRFLSSEKLYIVTEESLIPEAQSWIQGLKQVFTGRIEWIRTQEEAPIGAQIIFYGFKDLSKANLVIKHLPTERISIKNGVFIFDKQEIPMTERGWLLMSYDPSKVQTLAWVVRPDNVLAESWGKQLTHYSKFGLLFFKGKLNEIKTAWAEGESHLTLKIEPCKN
jgi:hypothetical protein